MELDQGSHPMSGHFMLNHIIKQKRSKCTRKLFKQTLKMKQQII